MFQSFRCQKIIAGSYFVGSSNNPREAIIWNQSMIANNYLKGAITIPCKVIAEKPESMHFLGKIRTKPCEFQRPNHTEPFAILPKSK